MDFDKDLQSIQEVRWLVAKAVVAQKELAKMSQQQVDGIAKAIADACAAQSERLAKMAVEETGFGIWQDKVLKNLLGSAITWDSVKDMKTVGIIKDDRQNGLMEVGVPMGVVAALIPSTNPTSTTMYKSIISIKAGNAIVSRWMMIRKNHKRKSTCCRKKIRSHKGAAVLLHGRLTGTSTAS